MKTDFFAGLLHGKTVNDIKEIAELAYFNGVTIVYALPNDNETVCFSGLIETTYKCLEGGSMVVTKNGDIKDFNMCVEMIKELGEYGFDEENLYKKINRITASYKPEFQSIGLLPSKVVPENVVWSFEMSFNHCIFPITDNGVVYCIGGIFNIEDLK